MRPNKLKQLWRDDQPAFGAWLNSCSPLATEQLASLSFDWLLVDGEHSPSTSSLRARCSRPSPPVTPSPSPASPGTTSLRSKRILDAGAYGVVIPWINSPQEAEQAVRACRYPPDGIRGFGPGRWTVYAGADFAAHANEEILCIIQIETVQAVERIDEILAVPGVDVAMIGPADLAMSMGIPLQPDNPHPDHRAACATVLKACQRHKVVPGIFTGTPEEAARRVGEGWRFLPVGSDMTYLLRAARTALRTARGQA